MSLTTANSAIALSFDGFTGSAQPLQGYSADDIFSTAEVSNADTSMGIDGKMSTGWKPAPIVQTFSLQADSPSNDLFDQVYAAEQQAREKFRVQGTIRLPGLGKVYQMVNGVITSMTVMADAGVTAKPRKFTITWESMAGVPM